MITNERNSTHYTENIGADITTDPHVINDANARNITIMVFPDSGTIRCEFTISDSSRIEEGTARWATWSHGNVSVETGDTITGKIRAFRFVTIGGTGTAEIMY